MSKSLEKAKDLAKKTNAAVMVVNDATDEAFVIMTLDEYERLVNQSSNSKFSTYGGSAAGRQIPNSKFQNQALRETNNIELESQVVKEQSKVLPGTALTEEELLAKINQEIKEWRSAQTGREQAVLVEMPPQMSLKNEKGEEKGVYKFTSEHTSFEVNNLEDEERFFLDDLG